MENIANSEVLTPKSGHEVLFNTITFVLGEQIYAVNILYIRDIVMGKLIYRIPNSDSILLGVTNLRGEIIPVFSLKEFLGFSETRSENVEKQTVIQPSEDEYLIIIKIEGRLFAIAVDKIHKNIGITSDIYNEGSYMKKWVQHTIFQGVIIDGDYNILMLDIIALLNLLVERNNEKNN